MVAKVLEVEVGDEVAADADQRRTNGYQAKYGELSGTDFFGRTTPEGKQVYRPM